MNNDGIVINNMDEPFYWIGDYSVTTQHLTEVENEKWTEDNDEPEMIYENFTDVELSSVYATDDERYVIHCTQYRCVEGEENEKPFDDNAEVIYCLHHYRLDEIFKQYESCTIVISQVYGTTADLTIIPNEVLISSNDLFNFVNFKPRKGSFKYVIYDKDKDAFVTYEGKYYD